MSKYPSEYHEARLVLSQALEALERLAALTPTLVRLMPSKAIFFAPRKYSETNESFLAHVRGIQDELIRAVEGPLAVPDTPLNRQAKAAATYVPGQGIQTRRASETSGSLSICEPKTHV